MSREKQIDEMAKDLCKLGISCEECTMLAHKTNQTRERYCKAMEYAKRAYEKGYRKQREGWWVYHEDRCSYICLECEEDAMADYYGEPNFTKYCPNCGAKMKGGAE